MTAETIQRFRSRAEAGRLLAARLAGYASEEPLVLGLPRGGVPVAYEVAQALSAPLDVWVVRKLGVPWQPELAVGAVSEGGHVYLAVDRMHRLGLSEHSLGETIEHKRREVEERIRLFRGDRSRPAIAGRTIVVVDDGIATGSTVLAAIRTIKMHQPSKIVLAVPVAASDAVVALGLEVDRVVALLTPPALHAVGLWYQDFAQVSDVEVQHLLAQAREEREQVGQPSPLPGTP